MKIVWRVLVACSSVVLFSTVGLFCVPSLAVSPIDPPKTTESAEKLFLVIAPGRFHAALADFVKHKQALLPTKLVALEDMVKSTRGVDDPEKLKLYLYAAWKERKLGYVLLVGDVDAMPVRYMVLDRVTPAAFDYAFYPCDLYYSDLAKQDGSFDDWNAKKEDFHGQYFGEVRGEKNKNDPINYDQIDYRPDVAVGRWPVSTVDELRIVAAKSIAYENAMRTQKHPGARRAGVFHVAGWVDARGRMDKLSDSLSLGWQVDRHFFTDKNPKYKTPAPNEANLVALLNAGAGLIVHAGHGSDMSWEGCFSVGSLAKVKNANHLPVMISAGCSTAYFAPLAPYGKYVDVHGKEHAGSDKGEVFTSPPPPPAPYQSGQYNPTGLGEQLLKRGPDGAVAYIGCNTGSQPCALTLAEGFVTALAKAEHPRVGDCWASAISYYYDKENLANLKPNNDWYPPSIFFQGMKFMLFGDPTLPMGDSRSSAVTSP
jgi:Peptidase family C25